MAKTAQLAYSYSLVSVHIFGIVGNILVIISILRQKSLLKNNYYFLVLQLAICDLGALIIVLLAAIDIIWFEKALYYNSTIYCVFGNIFYLFRHVGVGMMLVISVLRYRATVHPLKLAISRRKMNFVCSLVYIIGLIAGYGIYLPFCFMQRNASFIAYQRYHLTYVTIVFNLGPTIFMAAVYYKIGRALAKQRKHMKRVCSNALRRRCARDRRTFFVCLNTVLCYAIGNLPMSMWYIWIIAGLKHLAIKNFWVHNASRILLIVGSCSANPLIYGILDRKLLTFWKDCSRTK